MNKNTKTKQVHSQEFAMGGGTISGVWRQSPNCKNEISNEQNPEMDELPNGKSSELDKIQNKQHPERTKSRMEKIQNWTKFRTEKIQN